MNAIPLYPLKFEPICQYRSWGGRRLGDLLTSPLPGKDPVGEAWLLSDRDEHASVVADGPLKGSTITQLVQAYPGELLGRAAGRFKRFPLSLKFLDAQTGFSLQVHPPDRRRGHMKGKNGKTTAWVVLATGPGNRVYAGLKPGTTRDKMTRYLNRQKMADLLSSFKPGIGDAVFLKAGTVHALEDTVVFEIGADNDSTYHLYDRNDADKQAGGRPGGETGRAMDCIDFSQGVIHPVSPEIECASPVLKERLFNCEHFIVWRIRGENPFPVAGGSLPVTLVCVEGEGRLEHKGRLYPLRKGDVMLLPAALGACSYRPRNKTILFEITLPPGG